MIKTISNQNRWLYNESLATKSGIEYLQPKGLLLSPYMFAMLKVIIQDSKNKNLKERLTKITMTESQIKLKIKNKKHSVSSQQDILREFLPVFTKIFPAESGFFKYTLSILRQAQSILLNTICKVIVCISRLKKTVQGFSLIPVLFTNIKNLKNI